MGDAGLGSKNALKSTEDNGITNIFDFEIYILK